MHFIRILSLSFQHPKVYCISMLKNEENCSRNCLRMLNFASLLHLEETGILRSCYDFVCLRFCTELLPFLLDHVSAKKLAKKSSPTRLDMGLDRSVGSTIGS